MIAAYAGVRVLVLGASGFIGAWVVRNLARVGASPHAVVRDQSQSLRLTELGAAAVTVADLATPGAIEMVVRASTPAIVFNLAGYGVDQSERDPARMRAVNATLVNDLCLALTSLPGNAAWPGLRLVHVGSALEYGRVAGPITEDVEPHPDTDYGVTKLEAANTVLAATRTAGLTASVVRLFTVYGPGEHATRLLPSLINAARLGTTVSLSAGDQPRDFTYVEEAVEGLLRSGARPEASGQLLNVATGRLTTVRQFAETAATVLGIPHDRLRFGAMPKQPSEMHHGEVSTARATRLLGWHPAVSIIDGIRRTWEQERKRP